MSDKLIASKNAMYSMVMLYIMELEKENVDVRQKISTDISEIINISEEQKQYVLKSHVPIIKEYVSDIKLLSAKLLDSKDFDIGDKALLKNEADELYKILFENM